MKIIKLNIENKSDLYEKYSNNLSKELINYLIKETKYVKDDITIEVTIKFKVDNLEEFIKEGLIKTHNNYKKIDKIIDNKQLIFFIVGLTFLVISTLVKQNIIKEVILIAGWVAIWDSIDMSFNDANELKLNSRVIKKILNSEIKIKEE